MTAAAANKWLQFSKQASEEYTPHPALASDTVGDGNLHRSGINFRPAFTAAYNAEAYNNMMSKRPTLRGGGGLNPVAASPIRPVTAPAPAPAPKQAPKQAPAMMTKQQLAAHKARIVLDDAPKPKTVFIGSKRKDDPASGTTAAKPTTTPSSPSSSITATTSTPKASSAQPASSAPRTPVRTFVKGKLVDGPAAVTAAPAQLKQPAATDVPPSEFKIYGAAERERAQAVQERQSDPGGDAKESARAAVPSSKHIQDARVVRQMPSLVQKTSVKSTPSVSSKTALTMTDDGFLQIANARPSARRKLAAASPSPVGAPASSGTHGRAASETPSVSEMTQQLQDLGLTETSTKPDPKTDLAAAAATPGSVSGSWTIIDESLPATSVALSSTPTSETSPESRLSALSVPAAVVTTSESLIDLSSEWDSPKLAPKAPPTRVFESPAVRTDVQKEINSFWSKNKRAPVSTASAPNLFRPSATPSPMPFATTPMNTAQQQLLLQRYHEREAQLKREMQLQLEKEWNEMCRLLHPGTSATKSGSALFGLDQMQ
ncbi:hypothetical protein HDU87_003146 [Geranomyces variabilis]|uniref:Uncharacterized protein n=1 Tax=Geranomyces variabilis TaxID=109894 RepID=A0AAD5TMW2_9FUNG|nr:hypothetical protein HDU87_003146 [Geranomyces variabilis]